MLKRKKKSIEQAVDAVGAVDAVDAVVEDETFWVEPVTESTPFLSGEELLSTNVIVHKDGNYDSAQMITLLSRAATTIDTNRATIDSISKERQSIIQELDEALLAKEEISKDKESVLQKLDEALQVNKDTEIKAASVKSTGPETEEENSTRVSHQIKLLVAAEEFAQSIVEKANKEAEDILVSVNEQKSQAAVALQNSKEKIDADELEATNKITEKTAEAESNLQRLEIETENKIREINKVLAQQEMDVKLEIAALEAAKEEIVAETDKFADQATSDAEVIRENLVSQLNVYKVYAKELRTEVTAHLKEAISLLENFDASVAPTTKIVRPEVKDFKSIVEVAVVEAVSDVESWEEAEEVTLSPRERYEEALKQAMDTKTSLQ